MIRFALLALGVCLSATVSLVADAAPATQPANTRPTATRPTTTSAPAVDNSPVVATVGDVKITQLMLDRFIPQPPSGPIPTEQMEQQRPQVLDWLIRKTLCHLYVEDHPEIVATADVDARIKFEEQAMERRGLSLDEKLESLGLSRADMPRLVAESILQQKLQDKIDADPKEVDDFIAKHKDDLDGRTITAKHILIQVPRFAAPAGEQERAKVLLADVRKRIEKGELKFDDAIYEYSDDPGRQFSTTLPPFPRFGRMVEPFAAAAFATPVGKLSDIVHTDYGYHLIEVESAQDGPVMPEPQLRQLIQRVLGRMALDKAIDEAAAKYPIHVALTYVKAPRPDLPRPATRPATMPGMPGNVRGMPVRPAPERPAPTPPAPDPKAPTAPPVP